MGRLSNGLLVAGYLVAAAWGVAELLGPSKPDLSPPSEPSPQQNAVTSVKVPTVSIDSYNEIVERPLFYAGRQPQLEETAADSAVTASGQPKETIVELGDMRLTAIFSGTGKPLALFEGSNGRTQTLQAGDRLSGWLIEEIEDDRVRLSNRGREETLRVHQFKAPVSVAKKQASRAITRRSPRQAEFFRQKQTDSR